MQKPEERPYIEWEPYFNLQDIFSDTIQMSYIVHDGANIYWLENKPEENGRITIIKYNPQNNQKIEVLPSPWYVRTRVHEYGGRPYTVHNGTIYFVNFEDQRLYKYTPDKDSEPIPLTPKSNSDGSLGKYAIPQVIMNGTFLLFVYEKEYSSQENKNSIAYIPLSTREDINEPTILIEGNDFYGDFSFHEPTQKLAFITWNHPNMPWDNTELWEALLEKSTSTISVKNMKKIIGGHKEAICSPVYGHTGDLLFVMDEPGHNDTEYKNWWNLYVSQKQGISPLTTDLAEYGFPMWVLGLRTILPFRTSSHDQIIAVRHKNGKDELVIITDNTITPLSTPFTEIYWITQYDENTLVFLGASPADPDSLVLYDIQTEAVKVIQTSTTMQFSKDAISLPEFMSFMTANNEKAFGYFYKPKNPRFIAPPNDKPPLMIMVHGGPTSRAHTSLSLSLQYWTSQGFAVFNIDHRGSTGYGRNYRDKLLGNWGIVDMEDIAHVIRELQEKKLVSNQVVIRGGSAGGYAVQRALTLYPELFSAGASYYGIGNLETLARFTHKFESRYLDQLLGGSLQENPQVYHDRSPIYYLDRLKSPMILFQGLEDKVVTPEVSQEIANALKKKGITYEYVEYEGEAHGFRRKETNIDALTRESKFFKTILRQHS